MTVIEGLCFTEYGHKLARSLCTRDEHTDPNHHGPLLGSKEAKAFLELRSTRQDLREIERAVAAWENDEDFGLQTDAEYRFDCDADFLSYVGDVAKAASDAA